MAKYVVRLADQPQQNATVPVEAEAVQVSDSSIVFYEATTPVSLAPTRVVAVFQMTHVISVIRDGPAERVASTPPPPALLPRTQARR